MKNLRRHANENNHYKDQRFYKMAFLGYCHCCHKFGHKAADCRNKRKYQSLRSKQDTKLQKIEDW